MKLKNKKTGEIATLTLSTNGEDMIIMGNDMYAHITKLSELKDYEDYEEPKEYWYVNTTEGSIVELTHEQFELTDKERKAIGNYFDTREEAEKAVEKLKAWKRLKDKGFEFEGVKEDYTRILQSQDPFRTGKRYLQFNKSEDEEWLKENWQDLDLLFGGEE